MNWLTYPENVPERNKEYLISIGSYVTIAKFVANQKLYNQANEKYYGMAWQDIQEGGVHHGVDAFMEKPKCYEKNKDEELK
jgi:hypothetical protein